MKLRCTLFLIVIVVAISAHAQDIIIKINGDEIRCKVIELSAEQITYTVKAVNDSNVPETLAVKKADVFMIRYENGTKDVFTPSAPENAKSAAIAEEPVSEQIKVEGRKFYYHNRKIGKSGVISILKREKDKEINARVTNSVICSVFAPVLKFVSIPAGVVGFIILGVESNDNNSSVDPENRTTAIACLAGFVLGQAGGYTVEYFQYKNLKEAVKLYNAKH